MDVTAIAPGRDFRKAIDECVATCSVLLAVIGQEWLDLRDSQGGRRLDDPNDFVRVELASALRRDIPVVPVLVRGAKMPPVEQFPEDLKELAYRNAVELTLARWKSDVQVLLQALRPYLDLRDKDPIVASDGVDWERKPVESSVGRATSRPDSSAGLSRIEGQTIERVNKELAAYIGPISEVVVKRAARRCSSVEEFYGIAAQEIETEADRAKFLRSCRS